MIVRHTAFSALAACCAFVALGCSPLGDPVDASASASYFYGRSGDRIIYAPQGNWKMLGHSALPEVDASSFRVLDASIGADRARVYYRQTPQSHVDRETFVVVEGVWRDAEHVYYARSGEELLASVEDADPESFRYLFPDSVNPRMWARDDEDVFLEHWPQEVHSASFRFLNRAFVADRHRIYRNQSQLVPVIAVSAPIEVINEHHLRMGNRVLSAGSWPHRVVAFDELRSVRSVGDNVLVINGRLYEKGRLLGSFDGDVDSLRAFPGCRHYARDEHRIYSLWPALAPIEGADADSFAPARGYDAYALDADRVYYRGRVVDGADRGSFEIVDNGADVYARDRHGRFEMGTRP